MQDRDKRERELESRKRATFLNKLLPNLLSMWPPSNRELKIETEHVSINPILCYSALASNNIKEMEISSVWNIISILSFHKTIWVHNYQPTHLKMRYSNI